MSSYTILITKRFEKDLEICKKRGLKLSLLYTVIEQLKLNGTLPKQYRAHKLSGNYANYWECHIKGDWLLIWEQNDDELILILTSTGTPLLRSPVLARHFRREHLYFCRI